MSPAVILSLAILWPSTLFAQSYFPETYFFARAVDDALSDAYNDHVPAEKRKKIALALENYWSAFADRIPRLPPNELEWVTSEIASEIPDRMIGLIDRAEFAKFTLLETATRCMQNYRNIARILNQRAEATEWVSSIRCYIYDIKHYLEKANLIIIKADEKYFGIDRYNIWALWITDHVIKSIFHQNID